MLNAWNRKKSIIDSKSPYVDQFNTGERYAKLQEEFILLTNSNIRLSYIHFFRPNINRGILHSNSVFFTILFFDNFVIYFCSLRELENALSTNGTNYTALNRHLIVYTTLEFRKLIN